MTRGLLLEQSGKDIDMESEAEEQLIKEIESLRREVAELEQRKIERRRAVELR